MKINISARHMNVSEDIKEWAEKKFIRLEKYFRHEADADLTFSEQKHGHLIKLEATINYKGIIFRAEVENHDAIAVIDKAVDVIDRQIRRNKSKLADRFHKGAFEGVTEEQGFESTSYNIVKIKKFPIKPMSVEEAVLQLELVGHEFFMFRNSDDEQINVVYKRKNGDYGLIVPEND